MTEIDVNPIKFWSKVQRHPTGCWRWLGHKNRKGYGLVRIGSTKKSVRGAHRVAYALAYGHLNSVLDVCHSCDSRDCMRPSHLWQGTHADNNRDRAEKGRSAKKWALNRKPNPPESRRAQGDKLRGRKASDATKAKQSESARLAWARRKQQF